MSKRIAICISRRVGQADNAAQIPATQGKVTAAAVASNSKRGVLAGKDVVCRIDLQARWIANVHPVCLIEVEHAGPDGVVQSLRGGQHTVHECLTVVPTGGCRAAGHERGLDHARIEHLAGGGIPADK